MREEGKGPLTGKDLASYKARLVGALNRHHIDPADELVKLVKDDLLEPNDRRRALCDILSYLAPKVKPSDGVFLGGGGLVVRITQFSKGDALEATGDEK